MKNEIIWGEWNWFSFFDKKQKQSKVDSLATRALVSYPGSGNTWIRYLIGFRYNGDDDGGEHNYDDDHHHNRQREPLDFTLAAFLMTRAS